MIENKELEKTTTKTEASKEGKETENKEGRQQNRPRQRYNRPRRRNAIDDDIKEEVITTSRISKTTKGGKRFRFNAVVVVGDGKGRVGYGTGKAKETPDAIRKAVRRGKKAMLTIPLVKGTITHEVVGKASSTKVVLRPVAEGRGIVAGGSLRTIMQLAGVENISTKIHGPKNKLNTIRAAFDAISNLETREQVMQRREDDPSWLKPEPERRITVIIPNYKRENRGERGERRNYNDRGGERRNYNDRSGERRNYNDRGGERRNYNDRGGERRDYGGERSRGDGTTTERRSGGQNGPKTT